MAFKEITLNGPGQVRVRVVRQDATEAARVFTRSVPTSLSSPFGPRFRIRQVMAGGSASPWVYSRQVTLPFVLGQTARFRMRSVSRFGTASEWRYASIQTANEPGEPGSRVLEVFVRGLFDLLIDAFVDRVHLDARRSDATSVGPADERPVLLATQSWAERLGLDRMDVLLEASRLKLHAGFRETLEDFIAVSSQAVQTLRARRDAYRQDAVDELARAALYRLVLEAADPFSLSDQVWADLDDQTGAALSEEARELFGRDLAQAWSDYVARDQVAVMVVDALGLIASYTLREELPLAAYELLALVDTLKRVFQDALKTGISHAYLWEVRPRLLDRVLQEALDLDPRWTVGFSVHGLLVKPGDQVWATTGEPRAYLQEMLGRRLDDLLLIEDEILLKEQATFHPAGEVWRAYLWAFREVFEGLAAWRVYLHEKIIEARRSFSEGLPMGMGLGLNPTAMPRARDNAPALLGPDPIPHFAIERAELFGWSAFRLDDSEITAALGDYGASDTAFIMGRFIMGVTPMGNLTYS